MYYLLDNPNPNGPFYYTTRRTCQHGFAGKPHLIVIHTAENLPDWDGIDTGAEKIAQYAATTTRAVSWHETIDSDSTIPMLPGEYTGFHVRNFNTCGYGIEIATQAAKWYGSPDSWRYAVLNRLADSLVVICKKYDISPVHLSRAEIDAGKKGIVGHHILDSTRRTDPGVAFPWDYVIKQTQARLNPTPVPPPPSPSGLRVMGQPEATVEQAAEWMVVNGARKGSAYTADILREIAKTYYRVGSEYGVRSDLAIAQSGKETGLWSYKRPDGSDSIVRPEQWNFAGIGATGGVPGNSFPTIEAGVRAHMLRMRMYAKNDPAAYDVAVLGRALPTSHWGKYPTIQDFDGVWAVPGVGYGDSVVNHYLAPMKATTAPVKDHPLTIDEVVRVREILGYWDEAGPWTS